MRQALELAALQGCSFISPYSGHVEGVHSSGLEEFALDTLDPALAILLAEGGLLNLWNDEVDLGLTISLHPTEADWARVVRGLHLPDTASFGRIDLGVAEADLRSPSVAATVQQLFADWAGLFGAPYGYAVDEYVFEFFMARLSIHEDVRQRRSPAVLFWLQYFAAEYAAHIGLEPLIALGGQVVKLPRGVLVSFLEQPPDLRSNRLDALNAQWQERRRSQ